SFYRWLGPGEVERAFTAENYRKILTTTYLRLFAVSIEYAALTTAICLVLGYPVAWFIGRAPLRWRHRLLLLVMIPFCTNFLIRAYAWFTILGSEGLLNSMLKASHVLRPVQVLYTPRAVLLALVYTYLPFMILPIYGSVEKLDRSLTEAAADLGAGPVRSFL